MFGNNNNKEVPKSRSNTIIPSTSSHSLNSLVQGTTVEGAVKSVSDIRVDGTIKGQLICDAKVIIGPTGYVEGEIKCKNAVIEGKFQGSLDVAELLNIRESAKVGGEIATSKLIVQSGAVFNVACNMGAGRKLGSKGLDHSVNNASSNKKENAKTIVKTSPKPAGV